MTWPDGAHLSKTAKGAAASLVVVPAYKIKCAPAPFVPPSAHRDLIPECS
jgi:hypothetical protein